MILFSRTVDLPPSVTEAVLIYATVSSGLLPAFYFARLRDALDRAESQLVLHSWHLSRLAHVDPE